jgi:hypothetical protein
MCHALRRREAFARPNVRCRAPRGGLGGFWLVCVLFRHLTLAPTEVIEHLVARDPEHEATERFGVLWHACGREHVGQRGLHHFFSLIAADTPFHRGFHVAPQPRIGQPPATFLELARLQSCGHDHVCSSTSAEPRKV